MRGPLGRPTRDDHAPFYWLTLLLLMVSAGRLQGQAPADHAVRAAVPSGARPLPPALVMEFRPLILADSADSTRRRPFLSAPPGRTHRLLGGFGAGLALSPLLWCDECATVVKASTSLGLALAGAVSGYLLSRTF